MRTSLEMPAPSSRPTALRGPVLTFTGDPFRDGLAKTMVHEPDAIVAIADGRITHFGSAQRIAPELPVGIEIRDYGKDSLISAGFVDSHVHFPQTPMIAAYGSQLLDWLNQYTFPAELKFADKEYARAVAQVFLRENLRNGITTSCVYCTVHPQSVDALFEEAELIGLRLAAGKVLMDRNAPDGLRDTAQSGYDESQALIAKWHASSWQPPAHCGASIATA
jgi:guanine deaminase